MVSEVLINRTGGPNVLEIVEKETVAPGPGEAWIEQHAIGINFLDITQRNGASPLKLPSGLGFEAAGTVRSVGPGVRNVKAGDRVGYACAPAGAYASARLMPADRLAKLPPGLSTEAAAAILFKGLTAQYLLKSTFPVGPGKTILLYAASGGLGQIITRWAKHLGACVIGVTSAAKIADAEEAGCDAVIARDLPGIDIAEQVSLVTGGRKVDVVYDSIGQETLTASLDSLAPRGMLVSLGAASGQPPAVAVSTLNAKGSLFLTRPSVFVYAADVAEYQERIADVIEVARSGIIRPSIWRAFPLKDVQAAHAALEERRSTGSIILTA